jgi:hypothetical protein
MHAYSGLRLRGHVWSIDAPDFAEFLRDRNLFRTEAELSGPYTPLGDRDRFGAAHREGNKSPRKARPMASIFAKGRRKDMMLRNLLAETGTESLHAYLRKHHK